MVWNELKLQGNYSFFTNKLIRVVTFKWNVVLCALFLISDNFLLNFPLYSRLDIIVHTRKL